MAKAGTVTSPESAALGGVAVADPARCLAGGRYCDLDHPSIRATAERVLVPTLTQREQAVRLFCFVRDEIRYFFGPWGVRASETLATREGTCSNKNNLFIALLRSVGIPAAYGVLRVNAREYFGNITPEAWKPRGSADSTHIYAAAFLDGRWVRCDTSTDREIAGKLSHFNQQTRLVDWDGEHDAMDRLDPAHVRSDLGTFATVDELLSKEHRNATPDLFTLLNDFNRFVRAQPPFPSVEALMAAYFGPR
jgi:transglutaminase-like putative cysteine protease